MKCDRESLIRLSLVSLLLVASVRCFATLPNKAETVKFLDQSPTLRTWVAPAGSRDGGQHNHVRRSDVVMTDEEWKVRHRQMGEKHKNNPHMSPDEVQKDIHKLIFLRPDKRADPSKMRNIFPTNSEDQREQLMRALVGNIGKPERSQTASEAKQWEEKDERIKKMAEREAQQELAQLAKARRKEANQRKEMERQHEAKLRKQQKVFDNLLKNEEKSTGPAGKRKSRKQATKEGNAQASWPDLREEERPKTTEEVHQSDGLKTKQRDSGDPSLTNKADKHAIAPQPKKDQQQDEIGTDSDWTKVSKEKSRKAQVAPKARGDSGRRQFKNQGRGRGRHSQAGGRDPLPPPPNLSTEQFPALGAPRPGAGRHTIKTSSRSESDPPAPGSSRQSAPLSTNDPSSTKGVAEYLSSGQAVQKSEERRLSLSSLKSSSKLAASQGSVRSSTPRQMSLEAESANSDREQAALSAKEPMRMDAEQSRAHDRQSEGARSQEPVQVGAEAASFKQRSNSQEKPAMVDASTQFGFSEGMQEAIRQQSLIKKQREEATRADRLGLENAFRKAKIADATQTHMNPNADAWYPEKQKKE